MLPIGSVSVRATEPAAVPSGPMVRIAVREGQLRHAPGNGSPSFGPQEQPLAEPAGGPVGSISVGESGYDSFLGYGQARRVGGEEDPACAARGVGRFSRTQPRPYGQGTFTPPGQEGVSSHTVPVY